MQLTMDNLFGSVHWRLGLGLGGLGLGLGLGLGPGLGLGLGELLRKEVSHFLSRSSV